MSKIKVSPVLVSSEDSLPGLQTAAFLLCLHMAFSCVCIQSKRKKEFWYLSSACKDTSPVGLGPTTMTSFNLTYLHKGQTVTLGVRTSIDEFSVGWRLLSP